MSIQRLKELQQLNKRKGIDMLEESGRFARLASRHEDGTAPRGVSAFNLFQTPAAIASRMASIIAENTEQGATVLEPSAGLGKLYTALVMQLDRPEITLVEISQKCVRELYCMTEDDKKTKLISTDFLSLTNVGLFDAVCMNPPFKMGRDIKHIKHAYKMLKPGGLLVSLCYNGSRQNKILRPQVDSWEVLPDKSFKETGTGASVALLTWFKT